MEVLNKQLPTLGLDRDYDAGFSGMSREMGRAAGAFLVAFVLSLTLMYMILAAQFESFIHPVTILLSLPLSVPFAIFSLMVAGQNFSVIYSAIGILMRAAFRSHHQRLSRPYAPDSDDDLRAGRGYDADGFRHRAGSAVAPFGGHHDYRRAVALSVADAARDAGGLFDIR